MWHLYCEKMDEEGVIQLDCQIGTWIPNVLSVLKCYLSEQTTKRLFFGNIPIDLSCQNCFRYKYENKRQLL